MKELGFKKEQIERIYALLSNLNECNTKFNSNCKVKAIQMYVDNEIFWMFTVQKKLFKKV